MSSQLRNKLEMKTLGFTIFICVFTRALCQNEASQNNITKSSKIGKSIFNVISFPNIGCFGSSGRNGTCYTSSECTTKGGTGSGTCASGFGVCCIIQLACGKSSSDNCTYLVLSSTSTPPPTCVYQICQCNSNICRLRLDFMVFSVNGPVVGTAVAGNAVNAGGAIGDCTTDYFTVASSGNRGSPPICGFNSGQHMYIDTSSICSKVSFSTQSATTSRQYDIKVTQYACGDEKAGPPDCLQYFTGNQGTISSFNFPSTSNQVTSTATHLSNQQYDICFRRNSNFCAICFSPTINPLNPGVMNQASYGLSNPANANADSDNEPNCMTDYLVIPNAVQFVMPLPQFPTNYRTRFCGRILALAGANSQTVCTTTRPFRLSFRTDANEVTAPVGAIGTDETNGAPSGIVGFELNFFQVACPLV